MALPRLSLALVALVLAVPSAGFGPLPSQPPPPSPRLTERRTLLDGALKGAGALLLASGGLAQAPAPALADPAAAAAPVTRHTIDYSTFKRNLFNTPPGLLQFPPWMEGEWAATFKFVGADFPSSASRTSGGGAVISKDQIVADTTLPGFRRLSIAMVPDVGKAHSFRMRFVRAEDDGGQRVEEDRAFNWKEALESEVGRGAVVSVNYEPGRNANRATINLLPQATVNAQKIELFFNARAPLPPIPGEEALGESFRYVEDIRQVNITPLLAETTTIGDYRHVWELYRGADGSVKGYLSTVAYATPQDPLFQLGAFQPLVAYFHQVTLTKPAA